MTDTFSYHVRLRRPQVGTSVWELDRYNAQVDKLDRILGEVCSEMQLEEIRKRMADKEAEIEVTEKMMAAAKTVAPNWALIYPKDIKEIYRAMERERRAEGQ